MDIQTKSENINIKIDGEPFVVRPLGVRSALKMSLDAKKLEDGDNEALDRLMDSVVDRLEARGKLSVADAADRLGVEGFKQIISLLGGGLQQNDGSSGDNQPA